MIGPLISDLLKLPVTRVDLLRRARKKVKARLGLYTIIQGTINEYGLQVSAKKCFPKLTIENAKEFGADKTFTWWTEEDWNTGRKEFLDWLIEQYKNDKENLRDG
jgi:hypothetical protein